MVLADSTQLYERSQATYSPTAMSKTPRRRFGVMLDADGVARAAWKNRIGLIHVNTGVFRTAQTKFEALITRLQANDLAKDSGAAEAEIEGRCLVIPAPSGAGKSHILRRLCLHPALSPFVDDDGLPVRPLLRIKAPSPCTLKSLGIAIFKTLTRVELSANLKEHDVWTRVRAQLHGQGVALLVIDEFHHAFTGRTTDERRSLVETLKNLVIPDPNDPFFLPGAQPQPIGLVLAGMPWMTKILDQDFQLRRRCSIVQIDAFGASELGLRKAKKFLELVESRLEFSMLSGLTEFDMIRRMMKASNGYHGRMMQLVKEASFLAIDDGSPCIDRIKHLAVVFEDIFALGRTKNPFLVADVSKCPKLKEKEFEKLTRLRGAAVDNEGEQVAEEAA